jgi:hypothetical protein
MIYNYAQLEGEKILRNYSPIFIALGILAGVSPLWFLIATTIASIVICLVIMNHCKDESMVQLALKIGGVFLATMWAMHLIKINSLLKV